VRSDLQSSYAPLPLPSSYVPPPAATPLRRLGPYDLRAKIGEGGMATVYLGRAEDGRAVALKVIKDEFSLQPEFTNMFLDEAKIVSRLSHPNIVHVEELGNEGKRLYLAMELLAGQSLWHVWNACRERGVRLRYETIAWIGARVAAGLHHAHELSIDGIVQGLVHRDVNASNIIVGYDGTVKIIDFGLAKARGRISQTAAGVVKGKLAYMSPEQAIGKPLDRRTDVFALAATLWEITTDRRLFKGTDDVDTLKRVYAAKIPDPTRFVEGYPAALWEVLKRGLMRHADERWPDALAFSQALDEVAASWPARGGDAASVAKVMGELFAEQRARQERWTAEASRQDGAPALETLRPPPVGATPDEPAPRSVKPRASVLPPSASADSLFLLSAELMEIAPPAEEATSPESAEVPPAAAAQVAPPPQARAQATATKSVKARQPPRRARKKRTDKNQAGKAANAGAHAGASLAKPAEKAGKGRKAGKAGKAGNEARTEASGGSGWLVLFLAIAAVTVVIALIVYFS
jgi:serine/threonine protein kinase